MEGDASTRKTPDMLGDKIEKTHKTSLRAGSNNSILVQWRKRQISSRTISNIHTLGKWVVKINALCQATSVLPSFNKHRLVYCSKHMQSNRLYHIFYFQPKSEMAGC